MFEIQEIGIYIGLKEKARLLIQLAEKLEVNLSVNGIDSKQLNLVNEIEERIEKIEERIKELMTFEGVFNKKQIEKFIKYDIQRLYSDLKILETRIFNAIEGKNIEEENDDAIF